ncbi:MAG TPA: NAD(P)-dependent oxidoreductase [Xanthomonadales bacterium]|nr:NAD(P)-dependent oxidoreductase [Xanthomonadales bacterium]
MNVLLTGSSGWLGRTLAPRLRQLGHQVIGLDPVGGAGTSVTGSIADARLVRELVFDNRIEAVIHGGALHKPNIATHDYSDFVSVNIQGTLNLLQASVEAGSPVQRFVMTSTTSLMISREIRAGLAAGAQQAQWIDETLQPLLPRNIYGVSKLSAEHLCRMFHEEHGLPTIILRTSRFFPEEDDMSHTISQSEENTKVNELLFRRLSVEDAAESHVAALDKAGSVGFDIFIVSAKTPFRREDCPQLLHDAPAVVEKYFPAYPEIYARHGWSMFQSIDRVYDASKIEQRLGFVCQTGFASALEELARS